MFEKATKLKLRFESSKGQLSVEQLWDLPLTSKTGDSLDTLAIKYSKLVKEDEVESFVETVKKDTTNALRLDILKHIIKVKLDEKADAEKQFADKSEKERLMAILARKQNAKDEDLSVEDLEAKIATLG